MLSFSQAEKYEKQKNLPNMLRNSTIMWIVDFECGKTY